ncbi:MAG: ABC transporter substrate-binding protein [Anaerolineae bacterium]|nr:ABC transporter substrate-binding protein [Anaerolineae bacterium]
MRTKLFSIMAVLIVLSLVAACGPTPEPQTIVQTVEVEKTVVETVEVEKEVIQTVEVEKEVVKEVTAVPPPEGPEGTLVRALSTFPNSLDLPQAAERQASTTAWQLYDSLVYMTEENEIEPALAERWDISDDGTEYTFYLRQDVTFHNGEPFNADSVVFSWQRAVDNDWEYSDQWTQADSVEKIDDYTVKITTPEPNVLLMNIIFDQWAMVPVGFDPENPVGTGPFKFVEWVKGDHITMEANMDYWRGPPKIQTVIFRPIPESATRVAAIQTGEVDIVTRLSSEEAQNLLGVEDVTVIKYPQTRVYYIAFNNMTTGVGQPTEDPLVRQAMNYAVDVDAIIDALFDGFAVPATGYVATGELGHGAVEPFGYDPDKAIELLTEAGYPDGFAMDMACPAGAYTHFEEVCEAVVAYLGDVGIDVSLEFMESGQYWDLEANKELPPLFGDSWSAPGGEAFRRLMGALMGEEAAFSSWEDQTIIDMLNEIKATLDRDERKALYEELQVYMKEDPPFIYLYEPVAFEAINTRVQNYRPRSSEVYFLYDTFVVGE